MTIEIEFNSVIIQSADMQQKHPLMFSALQQYLSDQKTPKRRKPRKKRETVASLIEPILAALEK